MPSTYLLPERPETLEGFQWLAQEVKQADGEALVMRVATFEGLRDSVVRAMFNAARREEYWELACS